MINLSSVAYSARKSLRAEGIALSSSHAFELIAALLSYRTLAALQAEDRNLDSAPLENAEHVVLQPSELNRRISELKLPSESSPAIFDALVHSLSAEGVWQTKTQVHRSEADFQDHLAEDTQTRAWSDDNVLSAYAETNASIDEFYTDSYEVDGPLFAEQSDWSISLSGTHTGEQDPDRMYYGHRGTFEATYNFIKAGRCGLIEVDFSIALDFDRENDYDLT